jgi:hypothetical protein
MFYHENILTSLLVIILKLVNKLAYMLLSSFLKSLKRRKFPFKVKLTSRCLLNIKKGYIR